MTRSLLTGDESSVGDLSRPGPPKRAAIARTVGLD